MKMRAFIFFLLLTANMISLAGQSAPAARILRMPDGKPNFSGVWAGPAFIHIVGPNDTDTPRVTSFDRSKMAPFQPGGEEHFFRVIPVGKPHRADVELTFMGDATAKWEGDTLVIDTIGLREWTLSASNGWHSDALHTIERLRHIDATTVSYEITVDDPKIFTKPWSQEFQMKLHPTWSLLEQVCEENNRCPGGNCSASDSQKPSK